jgi:hypothetical protein
MRRAAGRRPVGKDRRWSMFSKIMVAVVVASLAGTVAFSESGYKEGGKEIGTGVKEIGHGGAHEMGQGAKDIGKATGNTAKSAGKATGKAFKKGGKETKKAGKATGQAFKKAGKNTKESVKGE